MEDEFPFKNTCNAVVTYLEYQSNFRSFATVMIADFSPEDFFFPSLLNTVVRHDMQLFLEEFHLTIFGFGE